MIQKKRINNDVFVRWGVFTPEGLPVDLTEVTSITIEARPQSSNGRYPMVSEVVDNFVEAYFLAKDQKVVGKYNLYLTYTIDDPNIIGGVATYTIDYCDAFELLPKSCFIDGEDNVDPVNIQGIIASFTYSMLTEEEKNDLASRLSGNSGAQNLSDLLDVTISNLEIDQILKYDGTKWVNATPTGGSSSNVSWGIPTSQYTPLTVNGVTRNLSLNNHTHHWDTITNRPLTDAQFQDLLEISGLWKLDNDGNLYTERNLYSHGGISAYNWGESPASPGGVYNLKELLDVGIINPQEDNILRFNGSHWVNVPSSNVGTLVEWSSETDNYVNLLVGDSSKSISLHGHKHEIEDINNLQDSLDFKQDNIPLGDIAQYYRGDKEWATLNTDTVVESNNLYYTPERVIELTGDLYAKKDHTHVFNSLTGLPNTLDGYGIIDAYNKSEIDNLISSTSGFWVKSVGLEAPTGFTVSNSPIIYEGNIKLSFTSGYSLPSNSKQYNWDLAFSDRHIHTNINVLNELTIDDVTNWNSIHEHLNDYNNPHQVSFRQLNNKPNTLLGYGITDVYNKTEVDYIFSNITPGESTIKNVYGYDSIFQSFSNDTLSDTFNAYTISRLHDRLTILEQGANVDPIFDTIKNWYNNIGRYWLLDVNNDALYTNKNVYSTKGVSAYGLGIDGGSGGAGALSELSDTLVDSRVSGDILIYNGTHWENRPQSSIVPDLTGYALETWVSSNFSPIGDSLALGETSSTAYRGDHGLIAYDHSQVTGNPHNTTFAQLGSKPTTLSGFGITDAVTSTVFDNHKNNNNAEKHLTQAQLTTLINLSNWWKLDASGNLYTEKNLYSTIGVSAYGLGSGGGSGGGGVDMLDDWTGYTTSKANYYVPASLLVTFRSNTLSRLTSLESGSATSITTTGSGNAITSLTKSGNTITATKGSTFSLSTHNHNTLYKPIGYAPTWGEVTGKPSTFTPATHTHSNISITAGTGLSGGGALSANRTLSIASTYAPNTSTSLGASKNLNDYQTAGFYHQTANANASTALNYPVASAGALLVQTAAGVVQTYKVYSSSNVYVRGYYNSSWTTWRKLVTASDSIPWARISGAPATATTHPTWAQVTSKPSTFTPSSHTHSNITITAGNGLTGGGALSADRTLTLGTPSNITLSSTNSVGTSNHAHNLVLGGTTSQYLNGATALVTIPTITAGNGLTGGGQLTATRTLTLGTPSTLTRATTNSVAAQSHTHAITTTTVGAASTIVATDASGGVRGNIIRIGGNWTLELSGTELWFKYGGVVKQKMFQDGSFAATGEVAAYSQGVAADTLDLMRLNLNQGGGDSKYLSSTASQIYFDIGGVTPLTMSKTEVRRGTSNNNVNLGTSAYPWANIYGVNLIASTNLTTPKITLGNGWTIEQTAASLTIRRNGVVKGTFSA